MTTKHLVAAAVAALLLGSPASAQSASDLLQRGIHAQEAAGDLDSAILIFHQVVNSASNKTLAAQAQYQLVLCMLQKGDRPAASQELAALERNFPDMPDLLGKARTLIPGKPALLPAPWGDSECAQLNVKRDGVATGEYLYYSADTWAKMVSEDTRAGEVRRKPDSPLLQAIVLDWRLRTKASTRSIVVRVDRDTMRSVDTPDFSSDDDLGDALAAPFAGPATDVEHSVFLMRRLPLAVGYKTSLPVTSNQYPPNQMELTVTGIEIVQTPAGKFTCYRVSFAAIGQTFWIGIEGARPLVKYRSGSVEAELAKVWGGENLMEPLAAVARATGVKLFFEGNPGGFVNGWLPMPSTCCRSVDENRCGLRVRIRKIHTPPAEIAQALQRAATDMTNDHNKVRPGSVQMRLIGGQQALSCLLDLDETKQTRYAVWIATETEVVQFSQDLEPKQIAVFRWFADPIVSAVRIP